MLELLTEVFRRNIRKMRGYIALRIDEKTYYVRDELASQSIPASYYSLSSTVDICLVPDQLSW